MSEAVEVQQPIVDVSAELKKNEGKTGLCHILSTKNATFIHVTDLTGRVTYAKVTGGMKVKSKKDEGSPYAAIQAAQDAAARTMACGITTCHIKIRARGGLKRKNPGAGAQAAIRTFIATEGMRVGRISCVTPVSTDCCRRKGGHRGRRV
ncbi:rps14 [Nucleospora cyclopteri]